VMRTTLILLLSTCPGAPCNVRVHRPCATCMLVPSPTLSPTDPVPRGLLTLCPGASSARHTGQEAHGGCTADGLRALGRATEERLGDLSGDDKLLCHAV